MSSGNDIDPQLRDTVQSSQPSQEYPPPTNTSPQSIRLPPPTSRSPYQGQPLQQHHPQFPPYAPNGPYHHEYYGPPVGHLYGQNDSPNGLHALPTAPSAPGPGLQYVSKRGGDVKRLRACEACRGLKVRCETDPNGGPCKRCLKSGRKCEITPPSRKRQKKTDSRVSELEKQLADIQAQLKMSGQTGGESDGERYGDGNSLQFDTLYRRRESQSPYDQQDNGKNDAEAGGQPLYEISENIDQKFRYSDVHRNGPLGAHIWRPSRLPFQKHVPQASASLQGAVAADVRIIADSVDSQLATSLMSKYVEGMLPQKPKVSAALIDKTEVLRRSKPVLFIAIIMAMLQTVCKDDAKAPDSSTKNDGPEKGNQALYLLSEVAMGNSGPSGSNEKGQGQNSGVAEDSSAAPRHPANAFVNKLASIDDNELLNKETWLEELTQDFQ